MLNGFVFSFHFIYFYPNVNTL